VNDTLDMNNPEDFFRAARDAADVTGACVLEHFTCKKCGNKQFTAHGFREVVPCGQCGKPLNSKVPQIPQPGQVTAAMWTEAISAIRRGVPVVNPETIEWIDKQEGHVKSIAITYSTHAIHQMLNALQDITRKMSGGHG
jgi:transcription elongation factor Elf1